MSDYSPLRRLSTSSSSHSRQEDLINAYEAEEERIVNALSRKLEQLREEKIGLENALEAESESHVNRLTRELTLLRRQQAQPTNGVHAVVESSQTTNGHVSSMHGPTFQPSAEFMLDAMMKENETLRHRLATTERDYIRITRLNEIYREELIEHRRRCGMPVDNLIGLSAEPYSQPTHRRSVSSISSTSSPPSGPSSVYHHQPPPPSRPPRLGVPIPRANTPSQTNHRPGGLVVGGIPSSSMASDSNTLSSSYSVESPFPFSPVNYSQPASLISNMTNITSPPSSSGAASFNSTDHPIQNGAPPAARTVTLSYPSVPPPSLSSSPNVPYHLYTSSSSTVNRDASMSPVEPTVGPARRDSSTRRGSFDWRASSVSRRSSVDRGARIAESGSLLPRSGGRSRAGSQSQGQTLTGQNHRMGLTEEEAILDDGEEPVN